MAPLDTSDEDVFRGHQEKTTIRLAENKDVLEDVRIRLKIRKRKNRKLLRKLEQLQKRSDALEQKIDSRYQRHKRSKKYEAKQSKLMKKLFNATCRLEPREKEWTALREQRTVLRCHRKALKAPLTLEAFSAATLRRVPVEILLEIFSLSTLEAAQRVGTGSIHVIAQVCAQWRAVAVARTEFWASFSCSLFGGDSEVDFVETYLQHSRTAPLSIELKAEWSSHPPYPILRIIAAHSEQIRTLRLTGSNWDVVRLSGFRGRLPQLGLLQLPSLSYGFSEQFELAPRLHTLVMDASRTVATIGIRVNGTQDQPVALSGFFQRCNCELKTLMFNGYSIPTADVLRIFTSTPGLEKLAITGDRFTEPEAMFVSEELFAALTICSQRPALLPGLKHLLLIDGKFKFRDADLVNMLQSRSGTLCSVKLTVSDEMVGQAVVQQLKALKESGMNLTLAFLNPIAKMVEVI